MADLTRRPDVYDCFLDRRFPGVHDSGVGLPQVFEARVAVFAPLGGEHGQTVGRGVRGRQGLELATWVPPLLHQVKFTRHFLQRKM